MTSWKRMIQLILGGALAVAALGLAAACGADPTPTVAPTATVDAAADFQTEWDALIEAAQKEGQVAVASTGGSSSTVPGIFAVFEEKFGIRVELLRGRGGEVSDKVLAERANGRYTIDLYITGPGSSTRLYEAGIFQPLEPLLVNPNVTDKSLWAQGQYLWFDSEGKYIFIHAINRSGGSVWTNTDLVGPDEIQDDFDILDPKWKGQIISHELPYQNASDTLVALYLSEDGKEYLRRLWTEMDVTILPDVNLYIDSVARGTFALGISSGGGAGSLFEETQELGLPLAEIEYRSRWPRVRSSSHNQVMVMDRLPNPNAAKLLLNWYLGKESWDTRVALIEAGEIGGSTRESTPLRRDISFDYLAPKYVIDVEEIGDLRDLMISTRPDFSALLEESSTWIEGIMAAAGK